MPDIPQSGPGYDALLQEIASFAANPPPLGEASLRSAMHCMLDTLGLVVSAMQRPECARWLGPVISGASLPLGARLPGTDLELDPYTAAYDFALCSRWEGLQGMWPGAELVSPADPLAPLFAAADWVGRNVWHSGQLKIYGQVLDSRVAPPSMMEMLSSLVRAQEIQGALAEANPWQSLGIDPGFHARVASAAMVTHLLGGDRARILAALSLAFQAGVCPASESSRAPWNAASDAGLAIQCALRALAGDPGCPRILTMLHGGFQDACHAGRPLHIRRSLGSSISEQVVYNLVHPDALAAQTAAEAALRLNAAYASRLKDIERIEVATQVAGMALNGSRGPGMTSTLAEVVSTALALGRVNCEPLPASEAAQVKSLSSRVELREDPAFTAALSDPDKRSLGNSVQLLFRDGTRSERVSIEYPIGHYRRRSEGLPLLFVKAESGIRDRYEDPQAEELLDLFDRPEELLAMPVVRFVDLWVG